MTMRVHTKQRTIAASAGSEAEGQNKPVEQAQTSTHSSVLLSSYLTLTASILLLPQAKANQKAGRQAHVGGLSMAYAMFVMFAMYGMVSHALMLGCRASVLLSPSCAPAKSDWVVPCLCTHCCTIPYHAVQCSVIGTVIVKCEE